MAVATRNDHDIPLRELAASLPGHISYRMLYRWAHQGVTSASGIKVLLETAVLPSGRGSSPEKYHRFLAKLNQ